MRPGELTRKRLGVSQDKMKRLFDRRTELHEFSPGDQVLVLLPTIGSPFQAKFSGPYLVLKKISELNYLLSMLDRKKSSRICHVNLMKPYYASSATGVTVPSDDALGGAVKPTGLIGSGEASSVEPKIERRLLKRLWLLLHFAKLVKEFGVPCRFGSWVVLFTRAQTC